MRKKEFIMIKLSKRITASLILTAMLAAMTASCGSGGDIQNVTNNGETSDAAVTSDDVTTSPLYELEQKDFGGREFRISVTKRYETEMWVEDENGDVCNDAVYNRNIKVSDYLNVKIVNVVSDGESNQVSEISKNIAAGDDVYDLTAVYTWLVGGPMLEGCFQNWSDVPVVDFSREWWVTDANEAFSIAGNQFVAVGDLSVTTLLLSYAVYFNQRIAEEYKFPNLYETVLDGKWTIDEMLSLSKDMYQDLNNDGQLDENDAYGFAGDKVTNLDVWTSAFDIPLIEKNKNGDPVACVNLERLQTALEKVNSLLYDNQSFISWSGDEIKVFANGNSAFLTTWINNSFTTLRSMKDDYGILPYPKLDEEQKNYYSNSMDNYSMLSVPKTVTDTDFVGTVTEALTRENHFSVIPAYYDVALTAKYARDEQSVAMLDIIMDGRKYDFSILHSAQLANLPYLFREMTRDHADSAASRYAAISSIIDAGLKSLAEKYRELGN